MARKVRIDMTGVRHGRLVGVAFSHTNAGGRAHWLFACDCGGEVIADGGNVRSGGTTSCGCLHREISAARLTVHGRRAGGRHDATYRAWQEINTICTNPASPRFAAFGARAVAVCAGWAQDFEAFVRDMGERPAGTKLARRDPAGDFGPDNCLWSPVRPRAIRAEQGHDTRRSVREPRPRARVRAEVTAPGIA